MVFLEGFNVHDSIYMKQSFRIIIKGLMIGINTLIIALDLQEDYNSTICLIDFLLSQLCYYQDGYSNCYAAIRWSASCKLNL